MKMKNILSVFLFLLIAVNSFAQDLYIPNNPYDEAPEEVKKRKAFNRERWFYEQRMFPNNYIPDGAYKKAQDMRDELRRTQGFYYNTENTWESIGPTSGSLTSWGKISSRMGSIKVHPTDPNIIYIGGACGGIWKTTNGGLNWMPKSDNQVSLSTGSIAIDPTNTNIIYYGTGEATYSIVSYTGRGLLKSTDGGDTWTNYTTGLPSQTLFARIAIRPGAPNELLAALGTTGGVYRSTDAGVSWVQVRAGRCDDVVFDPTGTKAYINGSSGVIISTDGGASFTQTVTGYAPGARNQITIAKTNPNILYASGYFSGDGSIRVYKSTDAGLNWAQVSVGTNFAGSQAWYDFYIYASPFNENLVYVGSIDTWRSTNGGTSFTNITNAYSGGGVHPDQQNMDFHPTDPNIIYIVNDGGLNKSTDQGNTFTNLNADLTLTQFYRMTSNPTNPQQLLGGTQDNGTQQTLGTITWAAAFGGDGGEVCFHPVNSQYILGETQNNGVQKSTNGGMSFSGATSGLTGSGAWVGPIIAHPDSATIFYTARQRVFKSTTWGGNWVAISSGISGTIRELAISKSNPSIIYGSVSGSIFKSTDRGYTFASVTNNMPGSVITSISIKPDNPDDVLLSFASTGSYGVARTTNGGVNWVNVSSNLPTTPVNDVMHYYPNMSTNVFICATDVGVFMSNNLGGSWIELANGLPNTVAMHLDYNAMSNRLTIGTHGRGTYRLTAPLVNVSNISSTIPDNYNLSQNYPNPFNPVTKIKYAIKQSGMVTLKVYDALGRNVSTIVNQNQSPGTYEAIFDASNLTSGIYFYKIETGNYAETKKMMVLK